MVSSVVGLSTQQLRETLAGFPAKYADDPEYQEARSPFPADWPM
jgi:hypothetical protein